jgi:D-arginine dehydrogenase
VVGPDPAVPAFCWLAGQGGYGIQTAPAMAKLAAELVTSPAAAAPPELSPARFRPM